jgi:putative ABC transport system permease protein
MPGGMVEKDFLKIFKYQFIKGDEDNALQDPYSIVLSQSTAIALFGNKNEPGCH